MVPHLTAPFLISLWPESLQPTSHSVSRLECPGSYSWLARSQNPWRLPRWPSLIPSSGHLRLSPGAPPSAGAEIALFLDSKKSPTGLPDRSLLTNLPARLHPHRSNSLQAPIDSACVATSLVVQNHYRVAHDARASAIRSHPRTELSF